MHFFGHKILINKTGLNIILAPPPHIPFAPLLYNFFVFPKTLVEKSLSSHSSNFSDFPAYSTYMHNTYTHVHAHHLQHTFVSSPIKIMQLNPLLHLCLLPDKKYKSSSFGSSSSSPQKNVATPTVSYPLHSLTRPTTHHHLLTPLDALFNSIKIQCCSTFYAPSFLPFPGPTKTSSQIPKPQPKAYPNQPFHPHSSPFNHRSILKKT